MSHLFLRRPHQKQVSPSSEKVFQKSQPDCRSRFRLPSACRHLHRLKIPVRSATQALPFLPPHPPQQHAAFRNVVEAPLPLVLRDDPRHSYRRCGCRWTNTCRNTDRYRRRRRRWSRSRSSRRRSRGTGPVINKARGGGARAWVGGGACAIIVAGFAGFSGSGKFVYRARRDKGGGDAATVRIVDEPRPQVLVRQPVSGA